MTDDLRPITYRTRPGVRVKYLGGPSPRFNGRIGTVQKYRRDNMLQIIFDESHGRCSEYYMAWPGCLMRVRESAQ